MSKDKLKPFFDRIQDLMSLGKAMGSSRAALDSKQPTEQELKQISIDSELMRDYQKELDDMKPKLERYPGRLSRNLIALSVSAKLCVCLSTKAYNQHAPVAEKLTQDIKDFTKW